MERVTGPIPEELLSDRGTNFLSVLVWDISKLLGVRKINTSEYHLQTDGLVEKFNSTLINLIASVVKVNVIILGRASSITFICILIFYAR